ncbi:HAD family phosphatase [Phenylobacterium sp. LjRoot164]|uniref:HAD family hydrolase n=1 Tax=unclassified Phenylobacterium TaxID=2640670 RepID=UPI003ECDFB82
MTLPFRPSAVVFDMDGLLFDTEALWQEGLLAAAAEAGFEVPGAVYDGSIGVRRSQCGELFRAHLGADFRFEDFHGSWRRHFWRVAEGRPAMKPGVLELLELLDQTGLPRAIATSSSRASVERHLAANGLTGRFETIVCRGDYEAGKPAPDPFLKAAERLGAEPRLCLALEDSHIGVRSAAAAGMMTVMAPDLMAPTDEIRALGVLVVRDLHEVRELVEASLRA